MTQRGKSMSVGLDDGERVVSVCLIHSFLPQVSDLELAIKFIA